MRPPPPRPKPPARARQERALRTRDTIVRAAAQEFERNGYHGTTLAMVCRAAQVTAGALTFHFQSKSALAGAVHDRAAEVTLETLRRQLPGASGAQDVAALTLTIASLLTSDTHVRAAARLSREFPQPQRNWYGCWTAELESRLGRAVADRSASPLEGVALLRTMASCVVAGAEASASGATAVLNGPWGGVLSPAGLARIWELILPRFAGD